MRPRRFRFRIMWSLYKWFRSQFADLEIVTKQAEHWNITAPCASCGTIILRDDPFCYACGVAQRQKLLTTDPVQAVTFSPEYKQRVQSTKTLLLPNMSNHPLMEAYNNSRKKEKV